MTSEQALFIIQHLRRNVHKGTVAPHKPLLLVWTLGAWIAEKKSRFTWQELEPALQGLYLEFGYGSAKFRVEYPYYYLKSDGLWTHEVELTKEPTAKFLQNSHSVGAFTDGFRRALESEPDLAPRLISLLVAENFPESSQEDLVSSLPAGEAVPERVFREVRIAVRNRLFRQRVLTTYEEKCALCRWDLHLDNRSIGLEAAHIRWHSQEGPDIEPNGLCLCLLHHRLFDRGLWTLKPNGRVLVSAVSRLSGTSVSDLRSFHDLSVASPRLMAHLPNPDFVEWHRETVFQG